MKIFLSAGVIILFCLYGYIDGPRQSIYYIDCLDNPTKCEGKEVLADVAIVTSVKSNGFNISTAGKEVSVKGRPGDIVEGKYLDVLGIFHKDGFMELKAYHLYRERKIKVYISTIPVFIVAWLLLKNFLLTGNRKKSNHA